MDASLPTMEASGEHSLVYLLVGVQVDRVLMVAQGPPLAGLEEEVEQVQCVTMILIPVQLIWAISICTAQIQLIENDTLQKLSSSCTISLGILTRTKMD